MNVFELLDELSSKSKEEIEFALASLMLKKKIDFINVSNAYVAALEHLNDDKLNKLIEAESCVLGLFHHRLGGKKESDQKEYREATAHVEDAIKSKNPLSESCGKGKRLVLKSLFPEIAKEVEE